MAIAVFFELCWLDILPVGTFIPPQLAASTFAALALTTHFSLVGADQIVAALILGLPLAWFGYHLEVRVRAFNNRSYNALLNWGRTDDITDLPLLLTLRSLMVQLAVFWAFFFAALVVLALFLNWIFPMVREPLAAIGVTWPHLWLAASFGGLMALRLRKAYLILAVAVFLVTGLIIGGLI